jgi:methylmalonyl-CoA mutase
MAEQAWALIQEVEARGGMTAAIETGWPKAQIETAAIQRQAAIDSGRQVIVGVNKYQRDESDPIEVLDIDNNAVREAQVAQLQSLRATRPTDRVEAALAALEEAARSDGNLLAATVEAMRVRATVGEVSDRLRAVFAEYDGNPSLVRGVYGAELADDPQVQTLIARITAMDSAPRLYMAKLGQDGHDRGSRVIASAFLDFGYDVQTSPLFQTPEEAAEQAIAAKAQVVGVSSLAAGHKTLLPALIDALRAGGREDMIVICGGVIPEQDYDILKAAGVAAIFGPGTNVIDAGAAVLDLVTGKIRNK